jgi:hypothetical protein
MKQAQKCMCAALAVVVGSGCWATPEGWACDSTVPCPSGFLCATSAGSALPPGSDGTCVSESSFSCSARSDTTCPAGQICNLAGKCAAPRYTASNDVVTDSVTGLLWQQLFPSTCSSDGSGCTISDAVSYCSGLTLGGFSTGWRLPTLSELFSLVDVGQYPTIDSTWFPGTVSSYYWTDTCSSGAPCSSALWLVDFDYGSPVTIETQSDGSFSVRCVR